VLFASRTAAFSENKQGSINLKVAHSKEKNGDSHPEKPHNRARTFG